MAEVEFLSDLAETLSEKIIITKGSSFTSLKPHILKLESAVIDICYILRNYEEDIREGFGFKKLEEILHQVDDLVDDIASSVMQTSGNTCSINQQLCLFLSPLNQFVFVRNVMQRVDTIVQVVNDFIESGILYQSPSRLQSLWHDIELTLCSGAVASDSRASTSKAHSLTESEGSDETDHESSGRSTILRVSCIQEVLREKEGKTCKFVPECVGRDDERKVVVDMLLDYSNIRENVPVVSIVGIAGVGKTILARMVYNDEKVNSHFEIKMWICISQVCNRRKIVRKIIKAVSSQKPSESLALEQLEMQLKKQIEGRIYLLVLDGAWEEDASEWWYLKTLLNGGATGSRILVTTRSVVVADAIGTSACYELEGLSEEYSRELFEMVAFKPGEASMELFNMYGDRILSKCRGVPLTINVIGSFLYGKSKEEWELLQEKDFNIVDIISRNYTELPVHLKRCFAYCSLFPEEYEIKKQDLISMWLAQGLVEPQTVEEIFKELFRFTEVKRDDLGDVVSCKMLDTTYCMAKDLAGAGSTVVYSGKSEFDSSIKHVSFNLSTGSSWNIPQSLLKADMMRTLLWVKEPEFEAKLVQPNLHILMSKFRSLRVLDFHAFGIEKLPHMIGELRHLRYLDLSKNDSLVKLPIAITKLQNLQTLKLNFCHKLGKLPKDIGKLIHLRYLEVDECDSLTYMPLGLKKLTSLQVLSQFIVNKAHSKMKARGGLRVLGALDYLKGRLKIELSGKWASAVHEASEANLINKDELNELQIYWGFPRSENADAEDYQAILDALQPHQNLKILCIEGYRGKDFPNWARTENLASTLPNMVVITIEGCKECQYLPPFGRLPSLKRLTLRYMDNVQHVENCCLSESSLESFFPSLEELTLCSFHNLKTWWKDEEELQFRPQQSFNRLLKLRIWSCPKLKLIPLVPRIEDLDLRNVNYRLFEAPLALPSSSVKHMKIKGCFGLLDFSQVERGLGGLGSLQYLEIDECFTLKSLSRGINRLTMLEELEISNCGEIDFSEDSMNVMSWKSLKSLRYLTLRGLPKMETLPSGLQYVGKLKFLWISGCDGLKSLPEWIGSQTLLGHIRIEACTALAELPHSLASLRSLVKIEILECPQLIERCKENSGEDWHKIKHARVLLHKSWRYNLLSGAEISQISTCHARKSNRTVYILSQITSRGPQRPRSSSNFDQDTWQPVGDSAIGKASNSKQPAPSKREHGVCAKHEEEPKFQPFTGRMYKLQS